MKTLLKSHILITFVVGCLLFGSAPTAHDFNSSDHHVYKLWKNDLIKRAHDDHWLIGYRYGDDCLPENRPAEKDLEQAITEALQVWLQPLRDMETQQPIVNEFRYELEPPGGAFHWRDFDLRLRFYCKPPKGRTRSGALVYQIAEWPPLVKIDEGTDVNDPRFTFVLIHELGHAMGLGDTYVVRGTDLSTKGGLNFTLGTQPAAIMNSLVFLYTNQHLTQDDKNGMIWLYKVSYEDLDTADCFFPNYTFEAVPPGCVPNSPLIFEVRQGHEIFALAILEADENIDVNAQDHTGATALHYAISGGHTGLVSALLRHDDIFVHLKDNDGRTPVTVAREAGDKDLAERLLAHPNYALNAEPKHKLATKWAALKKDY